MTGKEWRGGGWLDSALGASTVFAVLAMALSLPGLGSHGLVRMEGQVVATASEMLATGDYFVPRVYGDLFTYKPPFLYWLVAAALELTGSGAEWVIRLPIALSGLAMGLATLLFVGRVEGYRVGLVAAVAALTGALFSQKLRIAEFDAVLAALVGIAAVAACYALARERSGWAWWLCYPALAAALLTKGIPALMLFAPGLLLAALVTGRWRALLGWRHLLGAAIFLLLVLGYVWAAHRAAGWEAFRQPFEEATQRGGAWSLESLGTTLGKPIFIWSYFLPWSLALFWAWPGRDGDGSSGRLRAAAWSFLIAGSVAWMLVPTHESRYYLPMAVPLGIVSAVGLARMERSRDRLARLLPASFAGLVALPTLVFALAPASPVESIADRALLLGFGLAALALAVAVVTGRVERAHPTAALLLAAFCLWGAETLLFGPERSAHRDQRPAVAVFSPHLGSDEVIWIPWSAGQTGNYAALLYYLGRPVRTFPDDGAPPGGAVCLLEDFHLETLVALPPLEPIVRGSGTRESYALYRVGFSESSGPSRGGS